jgi:hypothetical protein
VKEQVKRFEGLYGRRDELVAKIPDFWLRVVAYSMDALTLQFEFFFETYGSIETPNIEDFDVDPFRD